MDCSALRQCERKVILPVWKDITVEDVKKFSPLLADRLGGIYGPRHRGSRE